MRWRPRDRGGRAKDGAVRGALHDGLMWEPGERLRRATSPGWRRSSGTSGDVGPDPAHGAPSWMDTLRGDDRIDTAYLETSPATGRPLPCTRSAGSALRRTDARPLGDAVPRADARGRRPRDRARASASAPRLFPDDLRRSLRRRRPGWSIRSRHVGHRSHPADPGFRHRRSTREAGPWTGSPGGSDVALMVSPSSSGRGWTAGPSRRDVASGALIALGIVLGVSADRHLMAWCHSSGSSAICSPWGSGRCGSTWRSGRRPGSRSRRRGSWRCDRSRSSGDPDGRGASPSATASYVRPARPTTWPIQSS